MRLLKSYRVQEVKSIVKKKLKSKSKKKRKGYWKNYHLSMGNDKQDFDLLLEVCREQGNPWNNGKRGPKPKMEPWEYASIQCFRRLKGNTYRGTEKISELLTGKFIDHSWVGKTFKKISPLYFKVVINAFYGRIKEIFSKQPSAYISDGTYIGTDRYNYNEDETDRKIVLVTWHIIVEYWYRVGLICIRWCDSPNPLTEPTRESPVYKKMMKEGNITGQGQLFPKDKGYDDKKIRELDKKHGFVPIIPFREHEKLKQEKKNELTLTEKIQYRFTRGIVEGIFGGTTTEHDNKTRMRLPITRQNDTILLGLKQNLQTFKRAIILILLKLATTPNHTTHLNNKTYLSCLKNRDQTVLEY